MERRNTKLNPCCRRISVGKKCGKGRWTPKLKTRLPPLLPVNLTPASLRQHTNQRSSKLIRLGGGFPGVGTLQHWKSFHQFFILVRSPPRKFWGGCLQP